MTIPTLIDLFACTHFALANGAGAVMPMCTDTIVLQNIDVIPARNIASPVSQPVRLYFDASVGPDSTRFQEIPVTVNFTPGTNLMYVIPKQRLRNAAPNGSAQRYELRYWCNYFRADIDPSNVTRFSFVTAVWFNATAEARHAETGERLDDACVFPNRTQDPIRYTNANSLVVGAKTCVDTVVFDHWSCSHLGFVPPNASEEFTARADCWPADTVVFTAWYRTVRNGTVTVDPGDNGSVVVLDRVHGRTGGYGVYDLRQDRTTTLLLTAVPNPGYRFQRWSCSHPAYHNGTARILSVQMPTDTTSMSFTPVFSQVTGVSDTIAADGEEIGLVQIFDQLGRQWWQGWKDQRNDTLGLVREHVSWPGIYYVMFTHHNTTTMQSICITP